MCLTIGKHFMRTESVEEARLGAGYVTPAKNRQRIFSRLVTCIMLDHAQVFSLSFVGLRRLSSTTTFVVFSASKLFS